MEYFFANPRRVLAAAALCIPIHASWFLIMFLVASQIGIELSFLGISMVTAISWLVVALPISFGGIGVRELSFIYLLSLQGVSSEAAVVLGAVQSAIFLALAVLGIPFFLLGRRRMLATPDSSS